MIMPNQDAPCRPLILVTNDDGIEAAGVHRLIDYVSDFADVICVCPDGPRSGQSMAITVNGALRVRSHASYMGAEMYSTNGTPVDCVKLAWHTVLSRRPDLLLSGINHGSNAAINVVYSGTMGAAFEGCAFGIPSIGFSLTDHSADADFEPCRSFVRAIVKGVLANGLPQGVCLNVNIPVIDNGPSGMRLARACQGNWSDEYVEYRDPAGKPFYMLSGRFENHEPEARDTDEWLLSQGIVSIVPTMLDRTAPLADVSWLNNLPIVG